jgi:hypothetical protein
MPGVSKYNGAATLVMTDGAERLVNVDLYATYTGPGSLPNWKGTIAADRDDLLLAVQSSFSLKLRLPSERTGQILVTHVDDEIDENGVAWASVAGVGDAPFGR